MYGEVFMGKLHNVIIHTHIKCMYTYTFGDSLPVKCKMLQLFNFDLKISMGILLTSLCLKFYKTNLAEKCH